MVTVSQVVQKLINEKVILQEAIKQEIASYGAIAKKIKKEVEEEIGREVTHHAIVTALRRYAGKIKTKYKEVTFDWSTDLAMSTNILFVGALKSPTILDKIRKLHEIIDFERGDVLHINYGRNRVGIVTNERYRDHIMDLLKGEKLTRIQGGLVSLSLTFSEKLFYTPGVLFTVSERFAWENINIYAVVSSDIEFVFLIDEKNAIRGYRALERFVRHRMQNREKT